MPRARFSLPRLHAITDERIARRPDVGEIARRLATTCRADLALHARGRTLSGSEHFELASRLAVYPPSPLFVNDRLDVALAIGAPGVQLGHSSLDIEDARALNGEWCIGRSVHNLAEAEAARIAGADYLVVGPVFSTPSHRDGTPLGTERLAEIARLGVPAIAIGGVTAERIRVLRQAGAYGVAAIRAFWDAADPAGAARRMLEELNA